MPPADDDFDALFETYVKVCNRALLKSATRFPYSAMTEALARSGQKHRVCARIIDDTPRKELHMAFKEGHIVMDNGSAPESQWTVRASYLRDVVKNADFYIDNPSRLDWEWLLDPPEGSAE